MFHTFAAADMKRPAYSGERAALTDDANFYTAVTPATHAIYIILPLSARLRNQRIGPDGVPGWLPVSVTCGTSKLPALLPGHLDKKEGLTMNRHVFTTAACALGLVLVAGSPATAQDGKAKPKNNEISFDMVVSAGAKACLPGATARVKVVSAGTADDMTIHASGLPANTDFDLFVIQVPNAPFGISWYQADLHTDDDGEAVQHVRGIFSIETFTVAPGAAPAPVVFVGPFPDASTNPPFNPIQTYHLGIWFDSPKDALAAKCPGMVTPFNGQHDAGIQVLNTSNFPIEHGPLRDLNP